MIRNWKIRKKIILLCVFFMICGQVALFFSDIQIPVNNPDLFFQNTITEKDYFSGPTSSQFLPNFHASQPIPEIYENGDYISSNGFLTSVEEHSVNQFYFPQNNSLKINSTLEADIKYHFNYGVINSNLSIELDEITNISIDLAFEDNTIDFSQINSPTEIDYPVQWLFQTIIQVEIPDLHAVSDDHSMLFIPFESLFKLDRSLIPSDFILIVWDPIDLKWTQLDFGIINNQIAIPLSGESASLANQEDSNCQYFTILNKHPVSSIDSNDSGFSIFNLMSILLVLGVIIVVGAGIFAMSSSEYRHLVLRNLNPNYGMHRLNMEDLFENENRKKIIDFILMEPGIHFNDLKRKCGLQGGQLAWHINMLESYGVIHFRKIGQFVAYFPTIMENFVSDSDLHLLKSRTTINILHLIQDNSEITASQIAKMLKLGRNTVKYHVDKLIAKEIIYFVQDGRKKKLIFNQKE
ncbi:hypothetical protein NEF87_001861 [Candidatus Lokiarchaeum ossiferum]|uniref:HVO-0163 N-terminal HTH domain-containing protein n=1 Tax=Candidatus Lokiarchaeum ossiferum TaxID=2951803 RepID=A0ABY6HQ72_9ARCH|nr:hypothetical protein NEF87_001861 [Candidatus Lokiarchaeum sp. B-35]